MTTKPNIIIITATYMNTGKSTLTKGLATALMARGKKVVVIKPVEVQCWRGAPGTEDGESHAAVTGQSEPRHSLHRLRSTSVPPLAAELNGVDINWDKLKSDISKYAADNDVCLVEGAGGACTPITFDKDVLDLARELDAPVLVIGRDAIQGAATVMMTLRAMRHAKSKLLGIAVNVVSVPDESTGQNQDVIKRCSGFNKVVTIRNMLLGATEQDPATLYKSVSKLPEVSSIADWILNPSEALELD